MARRYDTRATIFSPEGRLYQVEYALEAIAHAGTCLGILASDGVLLAAERRQSSKLLDDSKHSEKLYKLHENMCCSVAGLTSDANILINQLRMIAQRYKMTYQEAVPCEYLVSTLCNTKQAYTQFGGKRPFGVSFLYAGWDKYHGFQLFQSDPSGNYGGWKATCVGNNAQSAMSLLKQEYKVGEVNLEDAIRLAVKVLNKTMDTSKITADKCEITTLTRVDNETVIKTLSQEEIGKYIKEYEKLLAEQEAAAAAEKQRKASDKS